MKHLYIREFRAAEQEAARRIFYDGIMERIPNTAFRGLRQHPRAQLLYALLAGQCAGTRRGISALLTMPKPLTVWITINYGKFFKRWEYQTT